MTERFDSLDGLRGVCALSVVLFHAADLFHPGPVMAHGFLAVDMFFLLSGFVVAHSYETRLRRGLALKAFLAARARRLVPVYWLGAAFNLAVFLWMASSGYYPRDFTPQIVWLLIPAVTVLMLPAFGAPGDGYSPAMLNVTWSLLVEWIVNTLYAAGLFRLRTRWLLLMAAVCWAAMAVLGYSTGRGWCVGISRYDVFTYGLLRGIPAFFAGVAIVRLHAAGRLARLPVLSTPVLLALWLVIAVMPTFAATPTYDAAVAILACPLLLALLLRSDRGAPSWCRALGALSYPLYVSHPGVILLAQGTPLFGLDRGPDPLRALLVVAVSLAVAWAVKEIHQTLSTVRVRSWAARRY